MPSFSSSLLLLLLLICLVINYIQGGDLIKWDKAKVGYYVGVDIAEGSVSAIQVIIISFAGRSSLHC